MNRNIAQALYKDALAQVVDNKVFRLLVLLLIVFVLPTFLIGAREDAFVVAWNWEFPYEDVRRSLGMGGEVPEDFDFQVEMINQIQALFVNGIAGILGIMLSIAAAAFFVPRMLEKGAADTLFSKPVSRLALLLSRYFAGLLFVAILAGLMVGGMHVGLLVTSGYSDPGFLWAIPILIYLFGIVHAVSVTVGVMTRSSVAAIMITLVFWVLNGCVHTGWEIKELGRMEISNDFGQFQATLGEDPASDEQAGAEEGQGQESKILDLFVTSIDWLHYALPKTGDAKLIARKLRTSLEERGWDFFDPDVPMWISEPPRDFERLGEGGLDQGVVWVAPHPQRLGEARFELSRRPASQAGSRISASRQLEKELEKDPAVGELLTERNQLGSAAASHLSWFETRGNEQRRRRVWLFHGGKYLLKLEYDAEAGWAALPENAGLVETFLRDVHLAEDAPGIFGNPYERRFGWTARPLKYNAFFSIGSTLAFVLAVLGFGWFKLSRIDF